MVICNLAIMLHHVRIAVVICAFICVVTMLVYVLVVYCIALYLILSVCYEAWYTIALCKLSLCTGASIIALFMSMFSHNIIYIWLRVCGWDL